MWRNLQGVLTPVFAQVLEVLDRDRNLYLLYGEGLSYGLAQFWLDIFEDQHINLKTFVRTQNLSCVRRYTFRMKFTESVIHEALDPEDTQC